MKPFQSKSSRLSFELAKHGTHAKDAWKTGTSYGRRDAWSIGYNKHYTVGIWTGNFSAQGIPELSGANIATPLLFKIFNTIDYDSDQEWFSQPSDCDTRQVCAETGLPPNDYCTHMVSELFYSAGIHGKEMRQYAGIMISADEKIGYCQSCAPTAGYKKKWYKIITPEIQAWMQDNRMAFTKIPPHNPACEKIFKEGAPLITSPSNGTEYLISKKHPEPLQLVCRAAGDASMVYWYINNKFLKSAVIGNKQFFVPEEGPVKFPVRMIKDVTVMCGLK